LINSQVGVRRERSLLAITCLEEGLSFRVVEEAQQTRDIGTRINVDLGTLFVRLATVAAPPRTFLSVSGSDIDQVFAMGIGSGLGTVGVIPADFALNSAYLISAESRGYCHLGTALRTKHYQPDDNSCC
jgi:hypothetical protein